MKPVEIDLVGPLHDGPLQLVRRHPSVALVIVAATRGRLGYRSQASSPDGSE